MSLQDQRDGGEKKQGPQAAQEGRCFWRWKLRAKSHLCIASWRSLNPLYGFSIKRNGAVDSLTIRDRLSLAVGSESELFLIYPGTPVREPSAHAELPHPAWSNGLKPRINNPDTSQRFRARQSSRVAHSWLELWPRKLSSSSDPVNCVQPRGSGAAG